MYKFNYDNAPTVHFKNGLHLRPITNDIADKCIRIVARSFTLMNPLAQALGKTYDEEYQRIFQNLKIHQENPLTHALMDGDEIVHVQFCSKFSDSYLGKSILSDFDPKDYTEKQLVVINVFRAMYLPNIEYFKNEDFGFTVYCINPDYKKKNPSAIMSSQLRHYMGKYYKGFREMSFATNEKMHQITLTLGDGYNMAVYDHNKVFYNGKKIYENVANGCLKLNIFGCVTQPMEEYKYMEELINKYLDELDIKVDFKVPENTLENHYNTINALKKIKSRDAKLVLPYINQQIQQFKPSL